MTGSMVKAEINPGANVYRPGYEKTAEKIADLIASAGYRPGDRLPTEQELATRLDVSRSMVREAVKMLTASGLVRTRRGSGIYVSNQARSIAVAGIDLAVPADPEHILSLFEFRGTQELQTARLAAERITLRELRALEEAVACNRQGLEEGDREQSTAGDVAFHQGIAAAAHNPFLEEAVAAAFRVQRQIMDRILNVTLAPPLTTADQHEAILDAIRLGDPEAAAAAMRAHLASAVAVYRQWVRQRLADDDPPVSEQALPLRSAEPASG